MKKLFLTILCLCVIFSGFIYINSEPVYADTPEEIELKFISLDELDGEYFTNFKNDINSPYDTCKLSVIINNASLGEVYDIVWSYKYNNSTANSITFDEITNIFSNDDATFTFYYINEHNYFLDITSKVAGKFEISVKVGGKTANAILNCKYATSSPISINVNGETEIDYNTFSSLILTANLEYEKFMESGYTFVWYKNNTADDNKLPTTGKQCVLTKSNTSPGENKIIVVVKKGSVVTEMQANKIITLKTTSDVKAEMTVTGNLELDLDNPSLMEPITFTVTENNITDTIDWYLLTPESNVFVKQNATTKIFNYIPTAENLAGTYKVFAQVKINNESKTTLLTEVKEFNIKAKTITDEVTFVITTTKQPNSKTGVQSCKCEINTNGYYDEESIVWLVNGSKMHKGSTFNFEPTLANEYILEVQLVDEDNHPIVDINGKKVLLATIPVIVEATTTVNTWIIISASFVALVGVCIGAIIISNKCREKIW